MSKAEKRQRYEGREGLLAQASASLHSVGIGEGAARKYEGLNMQMQRPAAGRASRSRSTDYMGPVSLGEAGGILLPLLGQRMGRSSVDCICFLPMLPTCREGCWVQETFFWVWV